MTEKLLSRVVIHTVSRAKLCTGSMVRYSVNIVFITISQPSLHLASLGHPVAPTIITFYLEND